MLISIAGAWLLKPAPDGYAPEGWDPSQLKAAVTRTKRDFTPSEMLRGSSFYFLFLAYFFGAIAGLGLISQLVPFGTEAGITSVALIGLIVGAIGNTAGRVLSGAMSDNLGRLNVLRLMVVVSAVAMPLLYLLGSTVAFFVLGVFAVYFCYGALLAVFAATSADFYGTKHLGVNYGLLFLAWGLAAVVGGAARGPRLRHLRQLPVGVLRGRGAVHRLARLPVPGEAPDGGRGGLTLAARGEGLRYVRPAMRPA